MDDPVADARPDNAVVILLDSLNRHMIGAFGGVEFDTPNLDRLAARSLRFHHHYAGSLPCMPARHDILCGALDFLWRPWGSIELWEEPLTAALRDRGVVTKLVTDHPHLFETGGENYHTDFTAWDYQRGHESDPWRTRPDPSWMGAPTFDRPPMPYDTSRGWFGGEDDFPGPRTMAAAARWLNDEAPADARFLLFVDEFDPHEPFDTPEPYASMYDPEWEGPHLIWPPYAKGAVARGILTPEQARQLRACYGAKLTMIDAWLGRILDTLEARGLWETTAVILCTDHGHYLGERDLWGKPSVPLYEPMAHIPLMVAWPGREGRDVGALTTSVDLHATMLDVFGGDAEHRTHGRSLVPVITEQATEVREHVLAGVWGREVHLVTKERKYCRAPAGDNLPLSVWSNRWSTMPIVGFPQLRMPRPDHRAALDRMPGSTVPVIRQPFGAGDHLPFWAWGTFSGNHLYALSEDPTEQHDRAGERSEKEAADQLREALTGVDAPDDQLARLGLS